LNRDLIKKARVVANPGCYPTSVQLGFLPLVEAGVVDIEYLIADAKSGVSGAARKRRSTSCSPKHPTISRLTGYPGIVTCRNRASLSRAAAKKSA